MNDLITEQAINTLRFLSADGVQQANSGHPGLPMGTAAIACTIWTRHLHFNPDDPKSAKSGSICFIRRTWIHAVVQLVAFNRICCFIG